MINLPKEWRVRDKNEFGSIALIKGMRWGYWRKKPPVKRSTSNQKWKLSKKPGRRRVLAVLAFAFMELAVTVLTAIPPYKTSLV